jgi:hypothetical protein
MERFWSATDTVSTEPSATGERSPQATSFAPQSKAESARFPGLPGFHFALASAAITRGSVRAPTRSSPAALRRYRPGNRTFSAWYSGLSNASRPPGASMFTPYASMTFHFL